MLWVASFSYAVMYSWCLVLAFYPCIAVADEGSFSLGVYVLLSAGFIVAASLRLRIYCFCCRSLALLLFLLIYCCAVQHLLTLCQKLRRPKLLARLPRCLNLPPSSLLLLICCSRSYLLLPASLDAPRTMFSQEPSIRVPA